MLTKKYCLKREKDFQRVIQKGRKIEKNFLVLKFFKNSLKTTRIGFVVSQKVSKKASSRNKIKRRLRAIIKINLPSLKPGYDLIFFTKKGIIEKNFWEIKEVVEQILKEAKLVPSR
jgi:ribonuclease P protein component